MNDSVLTDIVRSCGGPYQRDCLRAKFVNETGKVVRWKKTSDYYGREGMDFFFPAYFSDAPVTVITDIVKAIFQEVCYHNETRLSSDTLKWIDDNRSHMAMEG